MSSAGTANDAPKARRTKRTRIDSGLLIKDALPENSGHPPQGVVRLNGRGLRFGEAENVRRLIILLFDCGGEEK